MSPQPSILHVARVSQPPSREGRFFLVVYWVLIAAVGGVIAQQALPLAGSTPSGVAVAVIMTMILLVTTLYSIRLRRMVWQHVLQRHGRNSMLKRVAAEVARIGRGDQPSDPAERKALYQAIFAAEAGAVPGVKRLAELERTYGVRLPRVWVVGQSESGDCDMQVRAGAGAHETAALVEGIPCRTRVEYVLGYASESGSTLLAMGVLGLLAWQVPAMRNNNLIWVALGVLVPGWFIGHCVYALVSGRYWSMHPHERGLTLECRQWPSMALVETVEVRLGEDVVWLRLDERTASVVVGVNLENGDLRLESDEIERPVGVLWSTLVLEGEEEADNGGAAANAKLQEVDA